MASPAAQAFFDKQSPQDRMAIIDSWGGADLTDEWFKNAQAAGSVAAAPAAPAAPAAADIRSASVGKSEDFARFDDAVLQAWQPFYDAAASQAAGRPQYRSSRGAPGFFDKPTECPAGQTPGGPDESSPCKSTDALMQAQEAHNQEKYGAAPAAGPAAGAGAGASYFGQDDPLQRYLTERMASGAGTFEGTQTGGQFQGGGVFSQGSGQGGAPLVNPAATGALNALQPPAPQPAAATAPVAAPPAAPAPVAAQVPSPGGAPALAAAPVTSAIQAPPQQAVVGGSRQNPGRDPDAFGVAQGSGLFEDLIDPRRARRDARTGGAWF
jgi:hypothetical protein